MSIVLSSSVVKFVGITCDSSLFVKTSVLTGNPFGLSKDEVKLFELRLFADKVANRPTARIALPVF